MIDRFGLLVLVIATLALSACSGALPGADGAPDATTGQPSPEVVATSVETVTRPEPASEARETPITGPAPSHHSADLNGLLAWRDQLLRNDAVTISINGLPASEPGQIYSARLSGDGGSLELGTLTVGPQNATLEYRSPDAQNLLRSFQQVAIARVPAGGIAEGEVVLSGELPAEALRYVRAILVSAEATPGTVGFALGLRQEADVLLEHAELLRDAQAAGDLALEHVHAEHILNIIRGSDAGDLNGDGQAQNPGDGFGLLPNGSQSGYIAGMVEAAAGAIAATDASEEIGVHARHVQICGENVRQRVDEIQSRAARIITSPSAEATRADALALFALAEQTVQGVDANLNELVEPAPGEGGVLMAYQHAQLMATLPLTPVSPPDVTQPVAAATTVPAPETAATPQPAASTASAPATPASRPATTPAANSAGVAGPPAQVVVMQDFDFVAPEIRVKAGSTVAWQNDGAKAHSATAVDASFDTGLFLSGETRSVTFDTPGTYAYYCTTHGTPDGVEGMVGSVIVEE